MSETYEAVQTIGGRWEIRGHHDDCTEGIPLNEAEIRRAVACLQACSDIPTEALEAGKLRAVLDAVAAWSDIQNLSVLDPAIKSRVDALEFAWRALKEGP